jgi:hypothetical protein
MTNVLPPVRAASDCVLSALLLRGLNERDRSDVYVRPSTIHGLGLFARRTFGTGETVLVSKEREFTADRPRSSGGWERRQRYERVADGGEIYTGEPERYINHSCQPNAFLRWREGVTSVIALRPIRPRDEVLLHYGVNLSAGTPRPCRCGSERCLGGLPGSFFELPLDVQVELSPLLASWFVAEHAEAYRAFLREAGLSEETLS